MKVLEIKTEDLENNIIKLQERAGDKKIIAVVKGNGYGLGFDKFIEVLLGHGINYLAVSSVEEAIELADKKIKATVLCMEATSIENEIRQLLDKGVVLTIGNVEAARKANKIAKEMKKKVCAHLKIDTGFSRYGFLYTDKTSILETIQESTSILVEGIFSHFSSAYFEKEDYTRLQYNRFLDVKNYLEENNINIPIYHICNSSAFLKYDDMFMDAVRIGSAFLGRISVRNNIGLKKIGMLKSNVVEIRKLEKGVPVGYSNSEMTKKPTTLAIVPVRIFRWL